MTQTPEPHATTTLVVTREELPHVLLVALEGELDLATAQVVVDAVGWAASHPGPAPLVLDLRALDFLDSTGVRTLVEASRECQDSGRGFALLSPTGAVRRILELTRLSERFAVVDDVEPVTLRGLSAGT